VAFTNKVFAQRSYSPQFSALVLYALMLLFSLILGSIIWFTSPSKLGYLFLALWIITLVIWHSVNKILSIQIEHIPLLLTTAFSWAFITALIFWYPHIKKNIHQFSWILKINLIQSVFYFVYFYALFHVYNLWDLGISYKIQSYSPFIPIILAAIIYREKISLKQGIGIALTAFSLYFFT
jgi:drug/metabolite transporter (DMT)-like permease